MKTKIVLASEVINLLKTLGLIFGLSDAVLGISVFALGNSLGDLVTNYLMSTMGFPMMALGACFGSPMMS